MKHLDTRTTTPVQPGRSPKPIPPRRHPAKRVLGAGIGLVRIVRSLARAGRVVREREHVSLSRQFLEHAWWYARHDFEPRDYYQFRLYDPAHRTRPGQYINQRQNGRMLTRMLDPDALLWDKRAFARSCADHGLSAIPLLAEWRDGRLESFVDDWPDELYSKPARSQYGSGVGVRAWKGGRAVVPELTRFLEEHIGERGAVVQPCITNHVDLVPFSNGRLSTLRITGCHLTDGTVELLLPTLRMPVGAATVDNFRQGNLVAPIDPKTGRLGTGVSRDLDGVISSVERHPDSGAVIAEGSVPFFEEACALCRRAHHAFPFPRMVGWDVAITREGPVLVEGNYLFGTEAPQVAHGTPLGQPSYLACAAHSRQPRGRSRT